MKQIDRCSAWMEYLKMTIRSTEQGHFDVYQNGRRRSSEHRNHFWRINLVLKFEIYENENTKHFKFENSKTSGFIRNVDNCSSDDTASHLRRLTCSAIPLWEPEISQLQSLYERYLSLSLLRVLTGTYIHFFQFCVSVHHIMINKNTSLMQLISIYFTYSKSLHVLGRTLPIIRRIWYCT